MGVTSIEGDKDSLISAAARFEHFRRVKVEVHAHSALAGRLVEIAEAGRSLAKETLRVLGDHSEATLIIPMPPPGKPYDALSASVDGREPLVIPISNADEARITEFRHARFGFQNPTNEWGFRSVLLNDSVFFQNQFPEPEFQFPNLVEDLVGRYTFTARFFDSGFHEVTTPSLPGRYGAIVEIHTEHYGAFKRYATLFHLPKHLRWTWGPTPPPGARLNGQVTLPAEMGIDPGVLAKHNRTLLEALADLFWHGVECDTRMTVALVGLYEMGQDPLPDWQDDVHYRDRIWWYRLRRKVESITLPHLVTLPPNYDREPEREWPLLVFLHGDQTCGDDLERVREVGPHREITEGRTFPTIVVSPQCPAGSCWLPEQILDLVDEIVATYHVDADRIYLTGFSMGGYGTWVTAITAPGRFAAIAPLCGTPGAAASTPAAQTEALARILHLPIWAFQGARDPACSPAAHQATIAMLTALGAQPRYTLYPDAAHDIWTRTYADPELYEWLLRQNCGDKAAH